MGSLERWLGGSPLGVLLKLIFLSLVVGVVLAYFSVTPLELLQHLGDSLRSLFGMGMDTVRDFGRYILTGAMIVLPLWVIARLMNTRR